MEIIKFSLGQLQTNCYFLIDKENNCLVFDPGDEGNFILEEIQIKKLKPLAILATHGHFDHVMAVGEIQKNYQTPFYISSKDLFLIKKIKESAEYFLKVKPAILPINNINNLGNKNFLKIKNFQLRILKTPGHTPGSVCFYFQKEQILFTGDTLFKKGIGRYDFSYSDKDNLIKSLEKIFCLPLETKIFPGHGEESTLEKEKDFIFKNFVV